MANVSSSNGLEKRPKLRFPGFDEPWKAIHLSDVGGASSGFGFPDAYQGEETSEIPFYKVSDMNLPKNAKVMQQSNNYVSQSTAKKLRVRPFSEDAIVFAKVGAAISHERKRIALSPFLIDNNMMAFTPKRKEDLEFIYHLFQKIKLSKYSQVGALPSYNANDILDIRTFYPTFGNERKKIVTILSLIDNRIEKQSEIITNLKKYKRGLSDELFGKKETTEEWTTVPFSEAFELLQNNTFSRDEMSSESGIAYNIHYGDVLIKYGVVVDLSKSNVPYIRSDVSLSKFAQSSYLRNGDIVIADTAEDYTVGKAVEIVGVADTKALSGLHTIPCRPKISFAPMYLGYFINSKRFRTQILPLVQGTKVSSISKSEIQKTSIAFPSFEVQSQIASMLYALDHRIDICQACVQGLVRTKEALLQQLFI